MRFVQTLHSPDAQEVEPVPEFGMVLTPAIMEDQSGTRLLLLAHPGQRLTDRTWDEAVTDGIGYVALGDGQGWYAAVEIEAATEYVEDRRSPFDFDQAPWIEVSGLNYDDVLDALGEAEEAAQTPGTFVHLHNHSEYSLLDGFSMVSEMVDVATAQGHTALAVTDHFHVAAHPELANRCKKAGIKPIFGIEANLVDDRHRRGRSWTVMVSEDGRHEYEADSPSDTPPKGYRKEKRSDAKDVLYGYQHITLWAETDQGLRNIWALASVGYTEGFYGRPRIDWEILERYSEGVIATTGCMRGPLAVPLLAGDEAKARENVARLMDIFPDRLYVEIHTNQLEDQIALNWGALALAQDYSLPYFAAVDSHYAKPEHKTPHAVWIAQSTSKDLNDEDADLFVGDQDYHMASEAEARKVLAYLGDEVVDAAIATTVQIADRCNAEMVGETEPPIFSKASREHPDPEARDVERLIDLCLSNWDSKVTPAITKGKYTMEQAVERFEYEMGLIVSKRFSGYFLLVADYVRWAKSEGCLVGPARGSGGASLVAHTADITHLDPIDYDLLFARFINEGRTELPDFDVDFPKSWRERLKAYLRRRWGEDHTLSIGTITRLRVKGAVDGIMRALKETEIPLPSWGEIALLKAADDASAQAAAGTNVPWEDFVADHQELMDALFESYPEFMALLEMFVGRVRGFSKHAAGMVVSTSGPLTDLPMRTSDEEDKTLISQFDMDALAALGYVKFDLLTLRTLDTLQQTLDRIEADLGLKIDPYTWDEEYEDPQVWEEVATGHTKGVFQVETKEGTRLTRQYGPRSVLELADVTTLVRPGPRRSGLTNIFLRRKDGLEEVTFPHPLLEETLGTSQGVPIFQEQVMAITMILGGYSSAEADKVRKLLGKKQVELVEEAGREFVSRCKANGVDGDVAEHIWEQLSEFAKYGFNKSHAVGYSVVSHWTAWFKVHFPAHYLASLLSTVPSERHGEFISEARRMGMTIAAPDINLSGVDFTPSGTTLRYGLEAVMSVGRETAEHIVAHQPYSSVEDFRERVVISGSPVNRGHLKALATVGAFDTLFPNRKALDRMLEDEMSGVSTTCIFKDPEALGPNGLPCTFDWANEPNPPMETKGRGKNKVQTPKPPPKRCTISCRNYTPPEPIDPETITPYTKAEVLEIEREMLGGWVSHDPFDRVPEDAWDDLHTADMVQDGPDDHEYNIVAILEGIRPKVDRQGGKYAFLTMNARDGELEAVCFASVYEPIRASLKTGSMVLATLHKNSRGLQVAELLTVPDEH